MNRYKPTLIAIAIFLILALISTWPLPLHLTTHAPGDGSDDPAILWNLWWVRFSLTELQQSPFESAWMFWPIGINLVFYTLTVLNGLLSMPLQLALGVVTANSFVVYFEIVAAALGTWLLVRWLFAQHPEAAPLPSRWRDAIALLSGVVFAFVSSRWLYLSLGQFNIAASHWLPWSVLYLARMWQAPTWRAGAREAALCALFALFSGWTEFTYASFFIQFAAIFWLWHVIMVGRRQSERARALRFTALSVLLGLIFAAGMSPILLLMLEDMRTSGDFLVEGLGFSNVFSNDLIGFLVPGDRHPLFGNWVASSFDFAYLNFAFVGWTTLALALVALISPLTRRFALSWTATGLLFALLSLGPTLRINGREWELPLPFDLMLALPLLKANRYPSRYSVMIALCLAVLVAWGGAAMTSWFLRAGRTSGRPAERPRSSQVATLMLVVVMCLILVEHAGFPLPLSDYRVPAVYQSVRERQGDALLELPLAWRNGFRVTGTLHNSFMFAQAFQSTHEKRLLSGNTSRNPPFKFQYFTELPLINSLLAIETGKLLPPGRQEDDAAVAADLLRLLDAPNIVIRQLDLAQPFPVMPADTLPYLETILDTHRWYERSDYVGLEASLPPAPERLSWDGRHPLARLFMAEGWSALPPLDQPVQDGSWPLYAEQDEARLLMPSISSEGPWRLSFESWVPAGVEREVALFMSDPSGGAEVLLGRLTLQDETEHSVIIPVGSARGALTEIIFRFDSLGPATGYLPGLASIGTTGTAVPYSLLVESAHEDVGRLANIYVNGIDFMTTGTGYHAALISADGDLIDSQYFDTFSDSTASERLTTFLTSAPTGSILALAAEDTVSGGASSGGTGLRLGDSVYLALETFGASPTSDMRGRHRWSHAFIGVKDAPVGTALEDSSDIRPARVVVGPPLQSPNVAMRVDEFRLEPVELSGE